MHYYQFNIGDYSSHTKGLSIIEDLAYRRLIDEYYLAEHAFNGCSADVARLIGLRDNLQEVEYILNRYFTKDGDSWHHGRIDSDIADYHQKQEKRSNAGKKSAEARQKSADVEQVLNECSTSVELTNNHKPRTINQEPIKKDITPTAQPATPKKTELDYSQWPNMPSEQTMADWLAMRKRLKAPISQTVINRFAIELKKAKAYGYTVDQCLAECVTRGWRGFETQWLVNSSQNGQYKTAAEKAADRNASTFDYEKARDF